MNKKLRVIEIRGFKGLLTAIFVICCLVTGFSAFPGFLAMCAWNYFAKAFAIPQMQLFHGIILWYIIFLVWFALSDRNFGIAFGSNINPAEIDDKEFIDFIKSQAKINEKMIQNNNMEQISDNSEHVENSENKEGEE